MGKAVKQVAQVAVGAVIGFIQGGPVGAAIGAGLAFYVSSQQKALSTGSSTVSEPSSQTVRSSKAPVRFILGRASTGGVLVWAQEQSGAQSTGEWVHLVYVLAEGPIDALEDILLGEESISSFGADATYELVINPTTVNAFLKANCPDWKDSQIGRGLSFVRLSLRYNAEKFPSGIPDTRFIVRGRNDIYDPRSGAAGYTVNTALHILWYLRMRCGVPDDEIVMDTFASAANVCAETVTNADGSTSPRYATSCVIGADEERTQVLQKLEASCAGKLIRVGGRWMLQAGAYYGPYDYEITEDMVIGTITGGTEPTNDGAINTVRGTFVDTTQSWADTDYPEVVVTDWVTEDGGEAAETLSFSYVTDPYQAQRLANIELRRRRAGGTISIPMNFLGYNCRPGRAVRVNLPSLNILGEFIVTTWSMGATEGCTVAVAQYEPAIYDDAVGQPYNPLGFIGLPSGGLGSPTGVTWTQDTSAEVVQGVVSWAPPTGIVTEYIVTVRQGAAAVQAHTVPGNTTQCSISGLPSGNYTISVAAVGPLARSGEATITISVNGPPIPESCVVQSSLDSITLIPANPLHGLNGGTYEYRFSTNPQATAETADYLGQGLTFTHNGLAFATQYYYFIRSVNAYGASAYLSVPASTSNDVSQMLLALAGKVGKTQLSKEINGKIELIDSLQDQIDDLSNPLMYVATDDYASGAVVYQGDRLYQAIAAVPAAEDGSNAPPNVTYWKDVGQILTTANGLALQVQENTADITELDGVVTAQASSVQALRAAYREDGGEGDLQGALKLWDTQATYSKEVVVRSTQNQALVQSTETLQASVASNGTAVQAVSAAVQTTSQAVADLSGKASAMWAVKLQVNSNGQYVVAGIGAGIENVGGTLQSNIIFQANTIAFASPNGDGTLSYPYIISGGVNYFNTAFFQDASISFLKVGDNVQSTNYVAGSTGWRLGKDGSFEINSALAGGGRQVINNAGGKVYDAGGVKRYQWGDLSV
jgi:hypothetical protein